MVRGLDRVLLYASCRSPPNMERLVSLQGRRQIKRDCIGIHPTSEFRISTGQSKFYPTPEIAGERERLPIITRR